MVALCGLCALCGEMFGFKRSESLRGKEKIGWSWG